jgi:hypothetical protein
LSDAKRPGSRDISELKQRLGLKKGASQSGSVPAVRSNGASGGVVPPPGLNLPPPPGVIPAAPPPPQPIIPNASEDPFGAMNAMAAVGTVHRAPEIVIVHDGRPVENVGATSSGARIAVIVGPAVLALIIGLFMGRTSRGGTDFNDGIASAASVYDTVHTLKTGALNDLTKIEGLPAATPTGKKPSAHPTVVPSAKLDRALSQLSAKLEVKPEKYAIVRNITLDYDTAGDVLRFYAGLAELRAMINLHVAAAVYDDPAYKAAQQAMADAQAKPELNGTLLSGLRYAIVLSGDKEHSSNYGARFVELGPPYCGTKFATGGKCADNEPQTGYGYRSDPNVEWKPADPIDPNGGTFAIDKIVPLQPSPTLDTFIHGSQNSAAENAYALRAQAIIDKAQELIELANSLESNLDKAKSQSSKFTFFM